jgi:hypothetical protein
VIISDVIEVSGLVLHEATRGSILTKRNSAVGLTMHFASQCAQSEAVLHGPSLSLCDHEGDPEVSCCYET